MLEYGCEYEREIGASSWREVGTHSQMMVRLEEKSLVA
jgi:hypothetical protein